MPRPSKKTIDFNPLDGVKKKNSVGINQEKHTNSSPSAKSKTMNKKTFANNGENNMHDEIPAETILDGELNAKESNTASGATTDYRNLLANQCVKNWSQWATVAGFIPVEFVDTVAISGVQLKMVHDLCKIYDVPFKKESAIAITGALVGGSITTLASQRIGANLISKIPYVGGILSGITQPVLAYGSTYALGLVFISHFEKEGSLHNFNIEAAKVLFKEQAEKVKVNSSKYYADAKQMTNKQISKMKGFLKSKLSEDDPNVIDMEVTS